METAIKHQQGTTPKAGRFARRIAFGIGTRGALGLVFGIVLLAFPSISLRALVLVFGAYAFIDGIVMIGTAVGGPVVKNRGWLALHGVLSVATGVLVWAWPGISALALLYVIGAWALGIGALQVGMSFGTLVRSEDRAMLVLNGLIGIAFGTIMFVSPGAGALALLSLIAAFAIVVGIALMATAVRIWNGGRKVDEHVEKLERELESGAA